MRLASIALITAALATPAFAQTQATPTAPPPTDDVLAAKLATAAELADQARRTNALNVEVNRKNREVQARNDAAKAAYAKAMADYQAQVAAQNAANAKAQADYEKQVAAWKADVAACKAGEVKRCAAPAPADLKTAAKASSKAGQP